MLRRQEASSRRGPGQSQRADHDTNVTSCTSAESYHQAHILWLRRRQAVNAAFLSQGTPTVATCRHQIIERSLPRPTRSLEYGSPARTQWTVCVDDADLRKFTRSRAECRFDLVAQLVQPVPCQRSRHRLPHRIADAGTLKCTSQLRTGQAARRARLSSSAGSALALH